MTDQLANDHARGPESIKSLDEVSSGRGALGSGGVSPDSCRTRPCVQCPWRAHADLTLFSEEDMAKLARANGSPGGEAAPSAPAMACHLDQPGTAHAMRFCAGWLAVVGRHHLGIRMKIISGRLPEQVLLVGQDWPELHASLDHLVSERVKQIASPAVSAMRQEGSPASGRQRT